jgi:hypothetical protein
MDVRWQSIGQNRLILAITFIISDESGFPTQISMWDARDLRCIWKPEFLPIPAMQYVGSSQAFYANFVDGELWIGISCGGKEVPMFLKWDQQNGELKEVGQANKKAAEEVLVSYNKMRWDFGLSSARQKFQLNSLLFSLTSKLATRAHLTGLE